MESFQKFHLGYFPGLLRSSFWDCFSYSFRDILDNFWREHEWTFSRINSGEITEGTHGRITKLLKDPEEILE